MPAELLIPPGFPSFARVLGFLGRRNRSKDTARALRYETRIERTATEVGVLKRGALESGMARWSQWAQRYNHDRDTVWLAAAGSGTGNFGRYHATYYRLTTTYLMIERPSRPHENRIIMRADIVDASITVAPRGTCAPAVDIILIVREHGERLEPGALSSPELFSLRDVCDSADFLRAMGATPPTEMDPNGSVVPLRRHA